MTNSIFSTQKKPFHITSKVSPREERIWRAKYNRFMRSRRPLVWSR